jgi:DNA repair exonuclease SbcCD nuclease subunit
MPKAFLISDIHLGVHPLKVDTYLDIAKDYFTNFLFPILEEYYREGDALYVLGDLFDNRSHIDIKAIAYALDIFKWLEEHHIKVEMIVGNHDMQGERSYEYNSLRILEKFNNINIYTKATVLEHGSKKILMLPYITDLEVEKEELKKYQGKVNYLFCHSDLAGAKNNINSGPLTHGPSLADFVAYPLVYSGHIHLRQKMHNFTFIGCPYHLDRNDKGDKKGIYVIDIETGKEKFFQNDRSPEYKNVDIITSDDIEKLEKIITVERVLSDKPIDDWYDITINNSLIIQKPELVRKLMDFSKKKSLASIKQIDDFEIKDTVEDISLEEIGVSLSIPDMVREYVKKQNFNDNIVKEKILNLLEDVIQTTLENKTEHIE